MNLVAAILSFVAVLAVAVVTVVLAATLRALDRLRRDVAELRGGINPSLDPFPQGVPVGSAAPAFTGRSLDGSAYSSAGLAGRLRLVAFARPGCPPCEDLVPVLMRGAERGELPPAVVISRGEPRDQPDTWRIAGRHARLVMEDDDRISRLFQSAVAPQVFVLTSADRVGARGIATSVHDVRVLVDAAAGAER